MIKLYREVVWSKYNMVSSKNNIMNESNVLEKTWERSENLPNPKVAVFVQGGFGNQLFQYAMLINYAKKYGFDPVFDDQFIGETHTNEIFWYQYPEIQQIIPLGRIGDTYSTYRENQGQYTEIPKYTNNLLIRGYFTSEKYFYEYRREIVKLFQSMLKIETSRSGLSLHIRRGNALQKTNVFRILEPDFYQQALKHYPPNKVIVISEDEEGLKWAKNSIDFGKREVTFQSTNMLHDFKTIATVKEGAIIANSTYSWWAAYLNPFGGKIVSPDRLFNSGGPRFWNRFLVKGWIQIGEK